MSTQHIRYPDDGILTVPTVADLPPIAADGTLAVVTGTDSVYIFDFPTLTWLLVGTGGGGAVNSVNPGVNTTVTGPPTDPIVNAGTEDWQFTGVITTPLLNNYINDWNPSGFATATVVRVFGDFLDPPIFTGLQGGATGRVVIVHNASQDTPIYFTHDDPLSAAGNRFMSAGFVASGSFWSLPINGMAIFQYDDTDLRWRIIGNYIHNIIDDGQGIVTVSGDNGQKVVGFNGVFTDGITITGNGTAFSPLQGQPALDVLENDTYFVDPFFGDDGTALPDSRIFKYQNINTALTAATAITNSKVYLMPGNHSMTSSVNVTEVLNIEMSPGATLIVNTGTPAFNIAPAQKLYITGEGQIQLVSTLFASSNPATSTLPEVVIRAKSLDGSGATDIGDITSVKFSIEVDSINDLRISGSGYSSGYIATDFWQSSAGGIMRLSDFTAFDGETKYEENGPQVITVKGRTRARAKFYAGQSLFSGVWLERGVESYKTRINLHVDFDVTDCLGFMDPGRGITRHWGDLIHRKTDTAGNEMPWFYMTQDTEEDFKPTFEHVEGEYVSGTNSIFAGSQNNEIISILKLCNVILNGRYQNSGENTGGGAWPIVYMGNQNASAGESVVTFNGEFKSLGGDVSPIRYADASNPSHTFKIINKTSAIQTRATYSIDTNVAFRIYVYHSLCMNRNYNPLISDGLSEDRTIADDNITVYVPEYGT